MKGRTEIKEKVIYKRTDKENKWKIN